MGKEKSSIEKKGTALITRDEQEKIVITISEKTQGKNTRDHKYRVVKKLFGIIPIYRYNLNYEIEAKGDEETIIGFMPKNRVYEPPQ